MEDDLKAAPQTPNLAVSASVSFPDAEIFGVKIVNGRTTKALIDITNDETAPVDVAIVGGALSSNAPLPAGAHSSALIVRNLTATRYDLKVPAGEKVSLTYTFTTDLQPQDLRLNLVAVVSSQAGVIYQIQAYNGTVSVVEAAISFFDPQVYAAYPSPEVHI